MEKRHQKFFYTFLLFNCFLSPACNHAHHDDVATKLHTNPAKNTVIKARVNAANYKPLLNLQP
jgi:hypothetical protein